MNLVGEKDKCPFCGHYRSNVGELQLYGVYDGFSCRTWVSRNGRGHNRGTYCYHLEKLRKQNAMKVIEKRCMSLVPEI